MDQFEIFEVSVMPYVDEENGVYPITVLPAKEPHGKVVGSTIFKCVQDNCNGTNHYYVSAEAHVR